MKDFLAIIPGEHPYIAIAILIVGIFLARVLLRATFKIALLASIIGIIMVGFLGYSPNEVLNKGKQLATYTTSYVENTIQPAIYNGLKSAHVEKRQNGTMELIGDNFDIGQTPQGKFVFHVKSLDVTINQDELSKFLSKEEMQKLLQTIQDKYEL
jgi:hypothetical protein